MKNIFGWLVPVLLFITVVLLLFGVSFGAVTLISLGAAWLLRLFLPLTLFESALLGFVFAAAALYLLITVVSAIGPPAASWAPRRTARFADEEAEGREYKQIAPTRFYQNPAERTWEAFLTHEIANDIYMDLQDAPSVTSPMNDSQVQELSIRLAQIGLAILKRKTARARDLSVNLSAVKREMQRMGQRPYDDDILRVAVDGINANVDYYADELYEIIRTQGWNKPAELEDEWN
ncbi:MAG: hypothetical protein DCC55_12630 [Chloroflexi bacterium]|nr:MAG: hypothetical protein DCC55_12630 [Chloroflexota bacterium]